VTDTLMEAILTRLEMVVLERLPHGLFLRLGRSAPPPWFSHVMVAAKPNEPVTIAQAMPFLGHFLAEAEPFWQQVREGRLRSDAFIISDQEGEEIALVASALGMGSRHLLVLERAADFKERRRSLQAARENVLEHEDQVRRTGALLGPLAGVQELTERLAAAGLTSEQEALAREIRDRLSAVAGSIETLAPLPKGARRAQT